MKRDGAAGLEHSQIAPTLKTELRAGRKLRAHHFVQHKSKTSPALLSKILPSRDSRADTARSASTQLLQLRFRSFQPQFHFHLAHHHNAVGELRPSLSVIAGAPI